MKIAPQYTILILITLFYSCNHKQDAVISTKRTRLNLISVDSLLYNSNYTDSDTQKKITGFRKLNLGQDLNLLDIGQHINLEPPDSISAYQNNDPVITRWSKKSIKFNNHLITDFYRSYYLKDNRDIKIGSELIETINLRFLDNKLSKIALTFSTEYRQESLDIFTTLHDAYGKPYSLKEYNKSELMNQINQARRFFQKYNLTKDFTNINGNEIIKHNTFNDIPKEVIYDIILRKASWVLGSTELHYKQNATTNSKAKHIGSVVSSFVIENKQSSLLAEKIQQDHENGLSDSLKNKRISEL